MEIKLSEHEYSKKLYAFGLNDYDVFDKEKIIHRVVTKRTPKNGDICNVYCTGSIKWGLEIDKSKTLEQQLKETREEVKKYLKAVKNDKTN